GASESLAKLSFGWRISRYLSIMFQPFLPFSSQRLWENLGETGKVSDARWFEAINWGAEYTKCKSNVEPLFERLDLESILEQEQALAESSSTDNDVTHTVKGGKKNKKGDNEMTEGIQYLDFETFSKTELKVGRILSVDNHENADKLYVVKLDDGTDNGRTICAGLKDYYSPEGMIGKYVVFVANLKPRKLRGVLSEGMMLAADDEDGNVKLITIDGDIKTGSEVR
ncbi:MAG: methionine--tRNA ligase subunit beta, partial [Euryarchaeota archaeon]|nr:methionine--tRNA ligase subunit beta [Euryarchaeota archaeon]